VMLTPNQISDATQSAAQKQCGLTASAGRKTGLRAS
jgi:hypothetical protein